MTNKLYYDFSKYRQYKNGEYMLFNKTTVYICIEDTMPNQTPITHPYKWQQAFGSGGGSGTVTSVGLNMPSAFTVIGSPVTSAGTFIVSGAGTSSQYIDGTGALQTFPGGGGTYTVNNGLTENPSNNFVLGGTLNQTTIINTAGFATTWTGNNISDTFTVTNNSTGGAVRGNTTSGIGLFGAASTSGNGVQGNSITGVGVQGFSNTGKGGVFSVLPPTANAIDTIIEINKFSSVAASNGIGGAIDYNIKSNPYLVGGQAARLISTWTDVTDATRTSDFQIWLRSLGALAKKLSITGAGQLIIDNYTTSTSFASVSGASVGVLNVDNAGKVFVGAGGGGGTGTVTSVSTAGLISGGPITTTGTITTSMNTNKLVGRGTAGVGVMEEITLGTGLSLSGTTLNATGGGIKSGTASGTNNYTVTIAGVTSYTDGDAYVIKFTNGNDADSDININGLGVKNLVKEVNTTVTGGDIVSGQELIIIYDGTNFQTLGVAPNQFFAYVTNDDSVTINKGQPVYAFGAAGNRMSVKLASNTADATSAQTVGVVFSTSIAPNQRGFIITQGVISGLNTSAYSPGAQLYLGATAGTLTATKPYAPNHLVYIGIVERANAGNGQIYVKPQNGYELDELHDVDLITSAPVNNDLLTYVTGSPNLWKNRSLGAILGGTTSQYVRGDGSLQTSATTFGVTCDGQGGVVTTGLKNYIRMPFSGTITGWSIISSISGSAVFDVWKSASGLPTVANTITGSAKPTLTANTNVVSSTLTGWNTSVVAGDYIGFNLDSCSTCVWLILQIYISKT